jgi:hypothetical protein
MPFVRFTKSELPVLSLTLSSVVVAALRILVALFFLFLGIWVLRVSVCVVDRCLGFG